MNTNAHPRHTHHKVLLVSTTTPEVQSWAWREAPGAGVAAGFVQTGSTTLQNVDDVAEVRFIFCDQKHGVFIVVMNTGGRGMVLVLTDALDKTAVVQLPFDVQVYFTQ